MAVAAQLVILLSLGQFQAQIPGVTAEPSPVFEDGPKGARELTTWAKEKLPIPKFNQPPLRVCVVGAVPFTPEKAPFLPKPLWESQQPLRALEPYTASFLYVEAPAPAASGARAAKPATPKARTMKDALALCAEDAKTPQPVVPKPVPPKRLGAAPAASTASK